MIATFLVLCPCLPEGCESCQPTPFSLGLSISWCLLMPGQQLRPVRQAQHFCCHHFSQHWQSAGRHKNLEIHLSTSFNGRMWDETWYSANVLSPKYIFSRRISLSMTVKSICWSIGVSIQLLLGSSDALWMTGLDSQSRTNSFNCMQTFYF